ARSSLLCPASLFSRDLPSFPTRRSSDLFGHVVGYHVYRVAGNAVTAANIGTKVEVPGSPTIALTLIDPTNLPSNRPFTYFAIARSEEHTSELQSLTNLVCRLLLEKKQFH